MRQQMPCRGRQKEVVLLHPINSWRKVDHHLVHNNLQIHRSSHWYSTHSIFSLFLITRWRWEEILEFGTQAPLLLPRWASGGQATSVVVQLDGVIDGGRHLNLDLLVGFICSQTLALDSNHSLRAAFTQGCRLSCGLGRLRAQGGADWWDGSGTPGLGATQTGGSGAASDAWSLWALGVRSDKLRTLELVELFPELDCGLKVVQGGSPVLLLRPFQGVSWRYGTESLLLVHRSWTGRWPGRRWGSCLDIRSSSTLGHNLPHAGQSSYFKRRHWCPCGRLGTGLNIHECPNLLTETQSLIWANWRLPLLGQVVEEISVAPGVRLAAHQDDWGGRGLGPDLRAPEV